jgi:hypothetical protein
MVMDAALSIFAGIRKVADRISGCDMGGKVRNQ